jgi:hypothetical protein
MAVAPRQEGKGRPKKEPDVIGKKLFAALKDGAQITNACQIAGVCYKTYRTWMIKGEAGDPNYVSFYQNAIKAIAEAELGLVRNIKIASKDDWRAAAWMLERRHSESWANTQRIQLEATKEVEKQVSLFLQKILGDAEIPTEIKQRMLSHACDLESSQEDSE